MFERFTHGARRTVMQAKVEAETLRHAAIGTEHLLLAMLDPESGATSRVLTDLGLDKSRVYAYIEEFRSPLPGLLDKDDAAALGSIGIDLDAVLARVEENFGAIPPPQRGRRWFGLRGRPATESRPAFAPRSKKVLELSLREALRLKHNFIGTEHILLGLVREGEGLAMKIMVDAGIDADVLRRRTESAISTAA